MNESFLHYLWQYQYFDKVELSTTEGEPVAIFAPGMRNSDAGPDFFNARVKIGSMNWIGNVEIHIYSSGWTDHKHDLDQAYENVILHVVWKEDQKIKRKDRSLLPTIELKNRVDDALVLQYKHLVNQPGKIPCAGSFGDVQFITKVSMLERALVERLQVRASRVEKLLARNNQDWEETAYQLISKNFGFKVNADPFEQLAQATPYKILMKHADKIHQIEALLFGQAGFLDERSTDEYHGMLKREHQVLSRKYGLSTVKLHKTQWKFLRLRPANFPTLRIAQLASLLNRQKNIFSRIIEARSYKSLLSIFAAQQSEYWQNHYQFFKPIREVIASLGTMSIDNIIINSVVPLLAGYGRCRDDQRYVDRAIDILRHIASEDNAIVGTWKRLGFESRSAADSQSLIELYNNFCLRRRCLDCTIGFSLMRPSQ